MAQRLTREKGQERTLESMDEVSDDFDHVFELLSGFVVDG
jgi:hypothetical protein